MGIEKIELSPKNFKAWDDFCQQCDQAWFWHSTGWINYILNRSEASENKSFAILKDGKIKAIIPLVIENNYYDKVKIKEFSFEGWAVPAPAIANDLATKEKNNVLKLVYKAIDLLAKKYSVQRASFFKTPITRSYLKNIALYNNLINYGFIDISIRTRIINLKKTKKDLWNGLRRNHKRNILKGKKLKIDYYTSDNITKNIFNRYKAMHQKAAGRKTRPDITFDLMYKWIKQNLAFLVVVSINKNAVGYEYYTIFKNNVYGFSAANDPDYDFPIRHFLEWQAILWMKERGYDYYEIGWQQNVDLIYDIPSDKQKNISHFKLGFGGFEVPLYIGEKFYDRNIFLQLHQNRINKFAKLIK